MADVHLAIDLGAGSNNGISRNPFVDSAPGADLYVVFNDHPPARAPVLVPFLSALEVEGIGADGCASLDHHIIADSDMLGDGHIGLYVSVGADFGVRADDYIGLDDGAGVDFGRIADSAGKGLKRAVFQHNAIVCFERVVAQQERFAFRAFHLLIENDDGSLRFEGLVEVFFYIHEGDVSLAHLMDLVDAGGHQAVVANDPGADPGGYFLDGNGV